MSNGKGWRIFRPLRALIEAWQRWYAEQTEMQRRAVEQDAHRLGGRVEWRDVTCSQRDAESGDLFI